MTPWWPLRTVEWLEGVQEVPVEVPSAEEPRVAPASVAEPQVEWVEELKVEEPLAVDLQVELLVVDLQAELLVVGPQAE